MSRFQFNGLRSGITTNARKAGVCHQYLGGPKAEALVEQQNALNKARKPEHTTSKLCSGFAKVRA